MTVQMSDDISISMTEAAREHVRSHLANRGKGLGIRLGVKTTGCSGLSYELDFVDEPDPDDKLVEFDDVRLYLDPRCVTYVNGTELDYVREGLNEGFVFNNPNVKEACGCGESFHV